MSIQKYLLTLAVSCALSPGAHADVAEHWPAWLAQVSASSGKRSAQGDIVTAIMGGLRPHSQDTSELVKGPGGDTQGWQRGGFRNQENLPSIFAFIAWNYNTYKIRNPKTDNRKATSNNDWIEVTPWPFSQKEVHSQVMSYLRDNSMKPRIQYYDPLGRQKNGGVVYQWVEDCDPKVVVRVCEIPGIQTTISFFSLDDIKLANLRFLERNLSRGERPLL